MFIRVKKIKGNDYAYLVSNEWTPNGSRQKVKDYFGAVQKHSQMYEKAALLGAKFEESLTELLRNELLNHGFAMTEDKNQFAKEGVVVDVSQKTVLNADRKLSVLKLNEGFLCEHTLKELFGMKLLENHSQAGTILANSLVAAGLKLSDELFIAIFEQLSEGQNDANRR
jgi:hypothetical protein